MYKSRLIYLSIVVAAFIFSQALYESVSYMTLIIVLILPFISVFLALLSFPLLKVFISTANKSIFRYSDFTVKIKLNNYSPFICPSFKINCTMPDDTGADVEKVSFMVNMSAGSGGSLKYSRFFANRGKYVVSVDSIEFFDFLKLLKFTKKVSKSIIMTVKPCDLELQLPVTSELQRQENSMIVGTTPVNSGGDMFAVRDYIFGDSMKNVHWKLSAKSEDIVVKTFAENIYDQAIVIADMSCYYDDKFLGRSMTDCVIEATLSAINDYNKSSVRFSLIYNVGKNENIYCPIVSPSDLIIAQNSIMMTPMVENSSVTDLLQNVDINIISGCEVCLITSFGSDDMIKKVKAMFIDIKSRLKVIRITELDTPEADGVLSYSKEYIEKLCRSKANEAL